MTPRMTPRHLAFAARIFTTATLAAVSIASAAPPDTAATDAWRDAQGERAQETPSMKSNKGFSAMIHLATKTEAERFLREWNSTAAAHAPSLRAADGAARGESIVLLILYAGCSMQAEGPAPCTATADLKITDPQGKTLMQQSDIALARDLPAYPRIVQLSSLSLQTDFDATDPIGVYRYDVVLRNPERNATLALSETIALSEKPASADVPASTTMPTKAPASAKTPSSP